MSNAPRTMDGKNIQPSLEHMAVWAEDLDATAAFLQDALGWRRHPLDFGVDEDSAVYGGMRLAFIDANGFWLELVQPTTAGPGMDFLKQKGNGSLVELDLEVADFDANVAYMKARGIELIGMDGNPVQDGGLLREWFIDEHGQRQRGDERLSYLPFDLSRGTSIELYWEYPSGVVLRRDKTWTESDRTPRDAPRFDHMLVITTDLEKTAEIYTDILNLPRHASGQGLRRDWMGFGAGQHAWIRANRHEKWIALMAPASPATGEKLLGNERFGNGAILEVAAEVSDIEEYCDRMQAKRITMTAGDGTPLPAGQKAVTVESTGDRYGYFPLDKSHGMRILVFQRGPAATSVFHHRDR